MMTSEASGRDEGPDSMAVPRARAGGAREAQWLQAVLSSIHEGMLVFDHEGLVLNMNHAFTDLFGYSMADRRIVPPYPWWPTEAEDADGLAEILKRHSEARAGREGVAEFRLFTRERTPVWVASADAIITDEEDTLIAVVRTFRDITRQKESQTRRAAAARVSADLAGAEDLATLLSVAQHGFEVLFAGGSTTHVDLGERYLFSEGRRITVADLTDDVGTRLAGATSPDAVSLRPGILLVPQNTTIPCRVWVQFPKPRRIDPDEMIAADLLAQAFGLAVDRLIAAHHQADLHRAIDSHRAIGQAVGILVERYRITPAQAFDRLRQASQTRNTKLRELAAKVVDTGQDPENA